MVAALHAAGIEVILDVVYNHTAEGNHLGPTLSFKGIDNPTYYRLVPENPRFYMDYTGTGNTLNMLHPQTLKLIMDSLRYWVQEMHVDGFRFDLAATLARELHEVDRLSAFFDIIHQDPVISQVKLIAEPWDVGEGGYQVGNFPVLWAEWNGRYRDTVRAYWRGDPRHRRRAGLPAHRLAATSTRRRAAAARQHQLRHRARRLHPATTWSATTRSTTRPTARRTATARTTTSAGTAAWRARPTTRRSRALREQQKRNFLATLFLSQGVPMLCAGDEMGRTQQGNNNAYCQDNEISWLDWDLAERDARAARVHPPRSRGCAASHPVFQRRHFFQGRRIRGSELEDITWLRPDGEEMTEEEWNTGFTRCFGMRLGGDAMLEWDEHGERVHGRHLPAPLQLRRRGRSPSASRRSAADVGVGAGAEHDRARAAEEGSTRPAQGTPDLRSRAAPVVIAAGATSVDELMELVVADAGRAAARTAASRFRVWAPGSERVDVVRATAPTRRRVHPLRAARRAATSPGCVPGVAPGRSLPLPAGRRRGLPRPRLALAAGGRARALARWWTRTPSPGATQGWRGPPPRGAGPLRAARGHLHAGGHLRRRGGAAGRAGRSWASRRSR